MFGKTTFLAPGAGQPFPGGDNVLIRIVQILAPGVGQPPPLPGQRVCGAERLHPGQQERDENLLSLTLPPLI